METRRAMLIAGRWVETGTTSPIRNPYNGAVLAEVCLAGEAEADEAIRAAVSAFAVSRKLPAHARSAALQKIAAEITARKEDFARCLSSESGKPITDACREIGRAITTFTVAAEEAKRMPGEIVPLDITPGTDNHFGLYRRVPIGPILGITPFNFPLNLVAHKVAPALAVGNPIVLKPAPQTPLTSLMLGDVILQTGLPAGMVSILPCTNAVAERMVTDERLQGVAALKAGNPAEDTTVIGPLIDEGAAKRVESWVREATAAGAKVRIGGKRQGSVVEATVLTDVTPQMKVSCQEVFGPIVTVSPYVKFEDALAGINDSPYGLQAGVFTRDIKKAFQSFRDLDVGTVLINEIPTFRADHMPYGGVKDSGLGREGLRYAIEEMTDIKLLVLNLS